MKFEQRIAVDASRDDVWGILSDFPRAASLMPDVSDVKELEDGSYQGTMRVRIGPVGLNLRGSINVDEDESSGRWNMHAKAQDNRSGGGLQATIEVTLVQQGQDKSELGILADVQFMGRLGDLGQPLIKRKADATIKEFANNLTLSASQKT